jgi:peptidoglycan hydrolase CwlO-like protein
LTEIRTLKAQVQADKDQLAKLKEKEAQLRTAAAENEKSQGALRLLKHEAKEGKKQIRNLQEEKA